ncbi:MAG: hypothetical protein Ct9H90mP9_1140 [Pseudomonadota bacterium]|nr:MAG: hypothetical protein Ct9H90mP9_1140 [Pseudomonadota bacterium]
MPSKKKRIQSYKKFQHSAAGKAEEIACITKLTLPSFAPADGIASRKLIHQSSAGFPIQFRKFQRGPSFPLCIEEKLNDLNECEIIKKTKTSLQMSLFFLILTIEILW